MSEKKEKLPKLNDKQEKFVNEYLIDLNGTKAAQRAGYSAKSARSQGSQLLGNPDILKHLKARMAKREKRTEISQDAVIKELAAVGFGRMTTFAEWGEGSLVLKKSEDLDDLDAAAVESVQDKWHPEHGSTTSIKLHNKLKALELLGKHLGMFNYEPEPIERDRGTNAERIRRAIRETRDRAKKRASRSKAAATE